MATAEAQAFSGKPDSIRQLNIDKQSMSGANGHMEFNPAHHLAYEFPEEVIMMKDIGYSDNTGISPVAVSQPFRLFTPEAVQAIRDEVLNEDVLEQCSYKSTIAPCQVRGYAAKHAPFVYDAWTHPETLNIISRIAGVDLISHSNFEIGHTNISLKSKKESEAELAAVNSSKQTSANDDDKPIVGWHTDSYPFVCVLMLSDCTNMVGGETALRTAHGDVLKVRGPQMGRYITHQALRALGTQERITMVTSFRPRSPHLPDDSVLSTTRSISDLSQLYYEFGRYRLEILEERIRAQLKRLDEAQAAGRKTDTLALKAFLAEQESFLRSTNTEIVPNDEVIPGHQEQLDFPDEKPVATSKVHIAPARAKLA